MTKKLLFMLLATFVIASCNKFDIDTSQTINKDAQEISDNAKTILGNIDPNQDWNSINSGSITVSADAPLKNIAKVQILTESPILNQYATILAEADVTKGETVELSYDAPNVYSRLIAACIDSDGHYHVKGFDLTESTVSFSSETQTTRAARRASIEYPDITKILLESKNAESSYNAKRTIFANEAAAGDAEKQAVATQGNITQWANSGWENDMLWKPTENYKLGGTWEVRNNTIMRTIPDLTSEEEQEIKDALGSFLDRTDNSEKWNRKDNRKYIVEKMRESNTVSFYNNQLTSDGTTPITIAPIYMPSTEIGDCHLYYYYYDPSAIPTGISEVDYIKTLPKFKAIQCWHSRPQKLNGKTQNDLFKINEYLLPYYGDELTASQTIASLAIPKGYRIGFMLRKLKNTATYVQNYREITDAGHGCSYGFGKLNKEINHLTGHFESGQTYFTMEEDDSRVCMFQANGKTYLGFEDGSDCQYNDYIIEVSGYDTNVYASAPAGAEEKSSGVETEYLYSDEEITGAPYTMCFEDRPLTADYDLNDVVLRCKRISSTELQLTLVACGGTDDVVIHGATGWSHNDQEVHAIFHAVDPEKGNLMINTEINGEKRDVISDFVTVDKSMTVPKYLKGIFIENKTTGKIIQIAKKGEAPFAIIVPQEFDYPKERQSITGAYADFVNWAQDVNSSGNWYLFEDADKIFPSIFKKWN